MSDESLNDLNSLAQHFEHDESPTPPPLDAKLTGALRFLPPFFREIAEKGVSFQMEGLSGIFHIEGFYRNGPMKIQIKDNDDITAIDKNGNETVVKNYDELMRLNFTWWKRSSTRNTYVIPHKPWITDFMKENLVERKVIYVPLDENNDSEEAE